MYIKNAYTREQQEYIIEKRALPHSPIKNQPVKYIPLGYHKSVDSQKIAGINSSWGVFFAI